MSINRSGETIVELATQSRKSFNFTSFVGYFMFYWSVFQFDICLNATNAVTEMERGHEVQVC